MAIDTTCFAADLAAMIADLPCNAKFGTTEFTCATTELSSEEMLMLTGNEAVKAVRIVHAADAFTVTAAYKPQARLQLKFPDASTFSNYEIVNIQKSPDLVSYETVLKADNRS